MSKPKYPHVEVQLSDEDGNAFFIISRTRRALKRAGVDDAEIEAFQNEAMSGDYGHVLDTCMEYVNVN